MSCLMLSMGGHHPQLFFVWHHLLPWTVRFVGSVPLRPPTHVLHEHWVHLSVRRLWRSFCEQQFNIARYFPPGRFKFWGLFFTVGVSVAGKTSQDQQFPRRDCTNKLDLSARCSAVRVLQFLFEVAATLSTTLKRRPRASLSTFLGR